jgi:hypothetical protein
VVGAAGRGARSMRRSQSRANRMRNLAAVNPPLGLPQRTTRPAAHRMGQSERLGSGDPIPMRSLVVPRRDRAEPPAPTDRRQHSSCRDVGRLCTRRRWHLPAGVGVDRRPVRVREPLERQTPLGDQGGSTRSTRHRAARCHYVFTNPDYRKASLKISLAPPAQAGLLVMAHHKACGQRRGDGLGRRRACSSPTQCQPMLAP